MKFNKLNSIVPPGQEQVFTSVSQQCSGHHIQMQFVCFEYCTDSGVDGVDCLFLGSETGCVYVYPIHKIAFARSLHPEEISRESPHGGQITSLIYLPARSWQPRRVAPTQALPASSTDPSPSSGGPGDADPALLVSGGLDRTIKVWMPRSRNGSHYVQTLYGHEGKISW